jgi:hypothetical protein
MVFCPITKVSVSNLSQLKVWGRVPIEKFLFDIEKTVANADVIKRISFDFDPRKTKLECCYTLLQILVLFINLHVRQCHTIRY